MKVNEELQASRLDEVKGLNGADRVLATLNLLGGYPGGIGLNDLARLMNSPRSSVHRALAALRRADLIEQDRDSRYQAMRLVISAASSFQRIARNAARRRSPTR